jgi:hypothetical protein
MVSTNYNLCYLGGKMKIIQEKKLWNILYELESLQDDKQVRQNIKNAAEKAFSCLYEVLADSQKLEYNRLRFKLIWKEIITSINEAEKWCEKYEKFEKHPKKRKNYMEADKYEKYKKLIGLKTKLLSLEQRGDNLYMDMEKLNDLFQATVGKIYYEIIKENGKSRNDLLKKLEERYPDYYDKGNISSMVDNIIYGKVKPKLIKDEHNESGLDIWSEMLRYLPELCGETVNDLGAFFIEKHTKLIVDTIKSMETYKNVRKLNNSSEINE